MVWKKVPWFEIFPLILAENPPFFPNFPDWRKSSKFSPNSLISLIDGNPAKNHLAFSWSNFDQNGQLSQIG